MSAPLPDLRPPEWTERAVCQEVDPDLWFPEKGDAGRVYAARRVCARCPVIAECLDYALANDERHGVWGGLSTPERRALRARKDDAA